MQPPPTGYYKVETKLSSMTQDAFRLAKRMRLSLDNHGGTIASDADLLQRFLSDRHDEVFAQLVQRHGPMVWGLCQRLLHHHADAEDAFQATFLTLFQHAAKIQKQTSLASWLYGVACRIAYKIKRTRVRAQQRELRLARPEEQAADTSWDQAIRDIMDAELARLPAHYREPLLLCYLQGQSQALAAQTLGWPIGTVAGRLSRAKQLLRSRLIRRGVAPAVAAGMSFDLAQAHLPGKLLEKTLHTIHTGGTSTVSLLTKGAVTTMLLTKWLTAGALGIALILGAGWGYSAFSMQGEGKKEAGTENQPTPAKQKATLDDYQLIQGQWRCEIRNEVTDTLLSVQDLTFRGKKYARSEYTVEKGVIGERNYESEALEFTLDPTQTPRRMELTNPRNGLGGGIPVENIFERSLCTYELNGDTLTINYGISVRYQVDQQGKLVLDPNSPQATFPKPGDPNVRKLVYHRKTPAIKREELEERVSKMLRPGEVAHAMLLPNTPNRKVIEQGDRVDIEATTKVADENGSIRTFFVLQDIEVLAGDRELNNDRPKSPMNRILVRATRPQSLTLKYHQDNFHIGVVKRPEKPGTKTTATAPNVSGILNTVSEAEQKLLEERVQACEDVVKLRLQAYKAGQQTHEFLLDAIKKRTEAKIDLAGNNLAAMRAALNEALDAAKEGEAIANAKYQAGSGMLLDVTTAKVERLNYELRLLRLDKPTK
jgi:RNA polymerase sigma factor (sigma-70 family)